MFCVSVYVSECAVVQFSFRSVYNQLFMASAGTWRVLVGRLINNNPATSKQYYLVHCLLQVKGI